MKRALVSLMWIVLVLSGLGLTCNFIPQSAQTPISKINQALTEQAQTSSALLENTTPTKSILNPTATAPANKINQALTQIAQTGIALTDNAPTPETKFMLALTAQAQTATALASQTRSSLTPTPQTEQADIIYYNGQVVTMEKDQPVAQAIAIRGEFILAVGRNEQILALKGPTTRLFDLSGMALFPGFIDSHAHRIGDRNLYGGTTTIDDVLSKTLAEGWTGINELFVTDARLAELQSLAQQNKLPLRVSAYLAVGFDYAYNPWYQAAGIKPLQQFGPYLQAAGIKITLDREWGEQVFFNQEQLNQMVIDATSHGWQVAIHSFSPAANGEALEAYEKALGGQPNSNLRLRLEHTGTMTDAEVQKMAKLGIIGSVQFINASLWVEDASFKKFIPFNEVEHTARWRDMLTSGIFLIGNTDDPWCCTDWRNGFKRPTDPASVVQAIYQGVTRQNYLGIKPAQWQVAQAVTVDEALKMMTINAAYANHQDSILGSLVPGKYADVVILSANPLAISIDQIPAIKVMMTMVGGAARFCASGQSSICTP